MSARQAGTPSVRAPAVNAAEREAVDVLRRALNKHARAVREFKQLGGAASPEAVNRRRAALIEEARNLVAARQGLDALLLDDS